MLTVQSVAARLDQLAPLHLAEEWDNVGLLVGDGQAAVNKIMTCLTITPASAAEAIDQEADLVVTHHPLPFQPLRRLTSDTLEGQLLLRLIAAGVAVYSAHTAFDSAQEGINQRLAEGLGLGDIAPLIESTEAALGNPSGAAIQGTGRVGRADPPAKLSELAERLKQFLSIDRMQYVGDLDTMPRRVAIVCGSGGQLLDAACRSGCDCLVTGEARFHICLAAQAAGVALLLPGHFASERFAQELLAEQLAASFPKVTVWASRHETDPLLWV